MLNIEKLMPFLIDIELTVDEFLILHLKHLNRKTLLNAYKRKFFKNKQGILSIEAKQKIVKLGYMEKDDTRDDGDFYYITSKFEKLYVDEFNAGNEFWREYPGFTIIKGKHAPLMNTDKNAFRRLYFNTIEGLKEEHKQILLDVKYGVKHDMINVKIVDFVRSEAWEQIRPLRLQGTTANIKGIVQTQQDDEHEF